MRRAALTLICSLAAGPASAQPSISPQTTPRTTPAQPAPRQTTMPQTPTCSGHVTVGCSAAWTDSKTLNDGNGDRAGPGDRGHGAAGGGGGR